MSVHYVSGRSLSALKFKNLNSKANDIGPRDIISNHSNRSYYSFSGSTHPEPKVIAGAYSRSGNVNAVTNVDYISILDGYCSKAYENTQKIRSMRAEEYSAYSSQASCSSQSDSSMIEQGCASALTAFHTNSRGFKTTMDRSRTEKGLASYDQHNHLETLVKEILNFHKDIIKAIAELLRCFPLLGPILGPIVYDIKCIIDELLNDTKSLTDVLLDSLQPMLAELSEEYGQVACQLLKC
ncbi:hypothetical protein BGW80DRAFT_1247282 [Lactifluus volemus]|nr:hypothetical protein BGW80DRAFT_1247282 [Lactifluus volemus]